MQAEWIHALIGGAIIGLAASVLLYLNGQVAGISGILGTLMSPKKNETGWRITFLLGLIAGGFLLNFLAPSSFPNSPELSTPRLIIAGVLVGFGTQLGSGCTSGHGVCGISRLSIRSIVATLLFITAGVITILVLRNYGVTL